MKGGDRLVGFRSGDYNIFHTVDPNTQIDPVSPYHSVADVISHFKGLMNGIYPALSDAAVIKGGSEATFYVGNSRFSLVFPEADWRKWWNKRSWWEALDSVNQYLVTGEGRIYSTKVVKAAIIDLWSYKTRKPQLRWSWPVKKAETRFLKPWTLHFFREPVQRPPSAEAEQTRGRSMYQKGLSFAQNRNIPPAQRPAISRFPSVAAYPKRPTHQTQPKASTPR